MADKTQVNPEKLKVLSAVMDKIEKDFGKGAIMKMSSKAVEIVPVIRSGSITLDQALGIGGYPKGRVIEIYGPESCDPCDRRGAKGGRHCRVYRCRTCVRQHLCPETGGGHR